MIALLLFETLVDDQPWTIHESINVAVDPGASWRGRGRDLLFRTCVPNSLASYPGMSAGGHQVAFRASLPNTAQAISTPALGVELMCDPRPDDTDPDNDFGGCASTRPTSASVILLAFAVLLRRRRR